MGEVVDLRLRKWASRLAELLGRPSGPEAEDDPTIRALVAVNTDEDLTNLLSISWPKADRRPPPKVR